MMVNDKKDIAKYIDLAERVSKPSKLSEWKERADKLAISLKMDIAVIESAGCYQLWPVSKSGNGVYVAKCVKDGEGNDNK